MNIRIPNIRTVASGYVPSGIKIPDVSGLQEALDAKQDLGSYVLQSQTGNFVSTTSTASLGHMLFYSGGWISRPLTEGDVVAALGYSPGSGDVVLPIAISDVSGLSNALNAKQDSGNYIYSINPPSTDDSLFYSSSGWIARQIGYSDVVSALGYVPYSGGGSGIALPIDIDDVNGLQASLDSKQATGNYAFASDITSLQSSKANTSHNHVVGDIVGLDGVSSNTFNVFNYGVSTTGTALANSVAFQQVMDEAGYAATKGSFHTSLYVPSCPATGNSYVELQWPVFMNFSKTTIHGDKGLTSRLRSYGPSIVVGRHPKYWLVDNKHFDDVFSSTGNLTNASNSVSNVSFTSRIRNGCGVSGVGIPVGTRVSGIDVGTSTIGLTNNATLTQGSELHFYSDSFSCSGSLVNTSGLIQGIGLSDWNRINIGALVSGTNIASNSYVLRKIPENSGIILSNWHSVNNSQTINVFNYVNNSVIEIFGNTTAGSNVVTNISNADIKRVSIENTCFSNALPNCVIEKVDRDTNSITISQNATSSAENVSIAVSNGWFDLKYYLEDVADFASGGMFKPLNGNAAFGVSTGRDQYKALRTRGRIGQFRFPFHTMATGNDLQYGQFGTWSTWPLFTNVTWEFEVYHHENAIYGGIVGAGSEGYPDPWFLFGSVNPANPSEDVYCFDLALTDETLINRAAIRLTVPQNSTKGIHRIAFQFNAGDDTDPIIAWVDGVRKQVKFYLEWADHKAGYHKGNFASLITGSDFIYSTPFSDTQFNKIARWEWRELTVGGVHAGPGTGQDLYASPYNENDFSVLAASCYSKLLYQKGTVGGAQTKIGGGAADDSYVWAFNRTQNETNVIGWLAFPSSTEAPVDDCNLNVHTKSFGKSYYGNYGYLCPRSIQNSGHGMYSAIVDTAIHDLHLSKAEGTPLSCAIYQGSFLYTTISDIRFTGFAASIGSSSSVTCYTAHYRNLNVSNMVHLVNQIAYLDNINFNFVQYSAMRTSGSKVYLNEFIAASPTLFSEGFWTDFAGGGINAGIYISNGLVNWEDFSIYPASHWLYTQKRPFNAENMLSIKNVLTGTFGVPILYIDDIYPSSSVYSTIDIDNTTLSGLSNSIIVRGSDWNGIANSIFTTNSDVVIKYLPALVTANDNGPRIKTVDKSMHTVTYGGGGFTSNCHEMIMKSPPEGGVGSWLCKASNPTGVFFEGSANPPKWVPTSFVGSSSQHALSANGFNSIYVENSVSWPNQTGVVSLNSTGFQDGFAKRVLNHLFMNESATKRGYFRVGYGYHILNMFGYNGMLNSADFFKTISPLKVQDYFSASSSGTRENNVAIDMTTSSVPDWALTLNRSFTFAFEVGENAENTVFFGKTQTLPSGYWKFTAGETVTIPSGGLKIKHVDRDGGWTIQGADKILNYLFDGSANPNSSPVSADFPSTFYIGLSKTPITASGTNINEPSGGYSRVAVSRGSGNWENFGATYAIRNKNDITFGQPSSDWGNLDSMFIADDPVSGNVLFKSKLNQQKRVFSGDSAPVFKTGSIQIQL